jgi:hypothetical protein
MVAPSKEPIVDRIAVLHGGPLDGKEYPIYGPLPTGMRTPAPGVFSVKQRGQPLLLYNLRVPYDTPDGVRYAYDWSHAMPHASD